MRCAITTQIAKACGALTFLFFRDRCAGTLLERQEAKWAGKFCLHDEDGNSMTCITMLVFYAVIPFVCTVLALPCSSSSIEGSMEGGGVTSLCQAWQDGGSRSYSLGRQSVALLAISGTAAPLSSLSLSLSSLSTHSILHCACSGLQSIPQHVCAHQPLFILSTSAFPVTLAETSRPEATFSTRKT